MKFNERIKEDDRKKFFIIFIIIIIIGILEVGIRELRWFFV